ncbi:DUF1501 domain-containing protein [Altererythrobacter lutimaris]|uniref:DUF1501 domain-containing protein n=1 Tax=Altererythrobacter lutimaris TaxID=2743979 RepID=A0A850HAP1_9SPHN|nr:DUF1501 domain-containing protein [Altererythrobacter lutimaris]NVE95083.1 DUF1501 domain-containing protein [Altererythrobacter lutimaris]
MTISLKRRHLLKGAGLAGAISAFPNLAFAAAPTDQRLVFIIQRGAADGLALVPPLGDPDLQRLRGSFMDDGAAPLDGIFGLHPALQETRELFASGQARAAHAVATNYRDRSHFDGQNVLESGATRPYAEPTGWIGRMRDALPDPSGQALAIAASVPLAMRGKQPVATFVPNRLPNASEDLLLRLSTLYNEDALLAPLWSEAMKTKDLAGDLAGNNGRNGAQLGELAARLMAPEDGARMMMIETGGWDTHSNQRGRLNGQLRGLDQLLLGLRNGLGGAWANTLIIVATEFGRTAAVNGTQGTDHGTASAMLMLGGSLGSGPMVEADWPGLSQDALFQGRDLKPTASFADIVTRELARHYQMDRARLSGVFA